MADFDPDKFLSETAPSTGGGFDPDKFLAETSPQGAPSALESGISGAANFMTLGFSDELAGAGRAAAAKVAGSEQPFSDLYQKYRDEQRQHQQQAVAAHPLAYYGGGAAGSLVTAAGLPIINPGAAATLKGAAARGALGGAITGVGESDAPVLSPRTVVGAVAGGALGAAGGAAGAFIPKLAPSQLRNVATEKAVQAAGGMTKEMRDLGTGGVRSLGQDLLDKKVVTIGASLEDIADRASSAKEVAGQSIGEALSKVDDLVKTAHGMIDDGKLLSGAPEPQKQAAKAYLERQFGFSGDRIAQRIEDQLIKPNIGPKGVDNPMLTGELAKLRQVAENFRNFGNTTLEQGTEMKAAQGARTRFESETIPESFKQQVYGIMKDELEDVVGKTANLEKALGQPETQAALPAYNQAKSTYGNMSKTEDMAERSLGRQRANRSISLTDYLTGIAGTAAHGLPSGIALGGVNKVIRKYGDSAAAVGLNSLANVIDKAPDALGPYANVLSQAAAKGGGSLAVTHSILMKNDPKYQQIMQGAQP